MKTQDEKYWFEEKAKPLGYISNVVTLNIFGCG